MIDLDRIEEWNKNDLGDDGYEVQAIVSKGDLLDIITSLRQAEKDAARWKKIKEMIEVDGLDMRFVGLREFDAGEYNTAFALDLEYCVDEAIKCK